MTQNCEVCGTPRALRRHELPPLVCGRCGRDLKHFIDVLSNYAYSCANCDTQFELASLVPHWDELFEYRGYALDSDEPRPKQPLKAVELEAILKVIRKKPK